MQTLLRTRAGTSPRVHTKGTLLLMLSCPALRGPVDCSPPGSSAQGILQARMLEQVAISSSRGSSHPRLLHWQADSSLRSHLGFPKEAQFRIPRVIGLVISRWCRF